MPITPRASVAALALAVGLVAGCRAETPVPEKVSPAPAEAASPEAASPEAGQVPAEAAPAVPPLTEEELALIAADPKDLTPELRRKRAYARRKQIMQNPDSPTARALNDLAEAHRSGELDVRRKGEGVWFSAPGSKPTGGRPPAGWRPPAGDATPPSSTSPAPTGTAEGEAAKAAPP